jgi:hypothetical protein
MLHFCSLKRGIGHTTFVLGLVIIVFSFLATACGANAASGNANGDPMPPVQMTPSPIANSGVSQGCPGSAVVTTPIKATVMVLDSSKDTTVNAHAGDVIEFRMSFGKKWSGPKASQGNLELLGPAGYASQASNACIWDFRARSVGTTVLTFNSQALCKRGQMCPMFIVAQSFTVQVK